VVIRKSRGIITENWLLLTVRVTGHKLFNDKESMNRATGLAFDALPTDAA